MLKKSKFIELLQPVKASLSKLFLISSLFLVACGGDTQAPFQAPIQPKNTVDQKNRLASDFLLQFSLGSIAELSRAFNQTSLVLNNNKLNFPANCLSVQLQTRSNKLSLIETWNPNYCIFHNEGQKITIEGKVRYKITLEEGNGLERLKLKNDFKKMQVTYHRFQISTKKHTLQIDQELSFEKDKSNLDGLYSFNHYLEAYMKTKTKRALKTKTWSLDSSGEFAHFHSPITNQLNQWDSTLEFNTNTDKNPGNKSAANSLIIQLRNDPKRDHSEQENTVAISNCGRVAGHFIAEMSSSSNKMTKEKTINVTPTHIDNQLSQRKLKWENCKPNQIYFATAIMNAITRQESLNNDNLVTPRPRRPNP